MLKINSAIIFIEQYVELKENVLKHWFKFLVISHELRFRIFTLDKKKRKQNL